MTVPQCEPLCTFNDRLYFTTFPHPAPLPRRLNPPAEPVPIPRIRPRSNHLGADPVQDENAVYYYFTIDHDLTYYSFFKDWGPLNLAMVYKACIYIHELLEDESLKTCRLVLYSSDDPRKKANAALLMALYIMIVQKRTPWEAFQPIAELEFMPFRDAGRGLSDFNLSIQDCLWGFWKAMQNGLCDMNEFDVNDYEFYEKVENGDWNWLTPNFIAFASPNEHNWQAKASQSPSTRKLNMAFQNCLEEFERRGVKMVVRLNNMLYDRQHFLDRGIRHEELYFDDGTNPTDEIVRKFINLADEVVEMNGAVAVHCKAGLGRTGTLIGAYLIWKYGFTAHEAIAFMRIVRPGSVVGPQQQYMYLKQMEWAKWAAVDEMRRVEAQAAAAIAAASVITPATPPADDEESGAESQKSGAMTVVALPSTPKAKAIPPVTPSRHVATGAAQASAIAPPGQPRKTPIAKRTATAAAVDESEESEDEIDSLPTIPATRARSKTQSAIPGRTGTRRVQAASEQRPTRVTRSVAAAANGVTRRTATTSNATGPNSPTKVSNTTGISGPPPKVPRLAQQTPPSPPARSTTSMGTRSRLPMPTPSRLPTLASNSRKANVAANTNIAVGAKGKGSATTGAAGQTDSWMKNNSNAVVKPGTKSERPGLRSIRRRRSSFSAADVVV